jgi:hypothetical protein
MNLFTNIYLAVGCTFHKAILTYTKKSDSRKIDVVLTTEYGLLHSELLDDKIQELMASHLQQVKF